MHANGATPGSSQPEGDGRPFRRLRAGAPLAALATLAALVVSGCAGSYTQPASTVGITKATVEGVVFDPADTTITYWFEYGVTTKYGSETAHKTIVIGDRQNHAVSADIGGLRPGTKYHFRLCAKDDIDDTARCANDRRFTTSEGPSRLDVSATPGIYPDFDPDVPDYVTRCNNGPVDVDVDAPADTTVAVDGQPADNGSFTTNVPLQSGQEFAFVTETDTGTSTYHVRCLPNGFPQWSFTKFAPAEQKWYIATDNGYFLIFDGNGVPVWWRAVAGAVDAKLLADGTLASGATKKYEVRGLDGSLLHTLKPVGADADTHDMLLLPNGNYLVMALVARPGTVDLTAYGGPADATVLDNEIQEIEPDGDLVWSWNTKDHISLDETTPAWWTERVLPSSADGYDVVHMNSLEVDGDGIVISLRHTDGVYKIDRETGDVVWKLGGTPTPESLTVVGDPAGSEPFGGQHDARMRPNGTLTVHDNGETLGRPPRGVQFQIDEAAGTATYLESITEPGVTEAICCGSARRSPSGSWLMGWGHFPIDNGISEFAPDGTMTFKLQFAANSTYRAVPVPAGQLTRAELRDGMDTQHPR